MPVAIKVNGVDRDIFIMGILNLSPDSFYDNSRCTSETEVLQRAEQFIGEGVDILDVGGESSRPGSKPVPLDVELERTVPVIEKIRKHFDIPLSVDTYKPEVAKQVLGEGADLINDITGLQRHTEMARIIAQAQARVVIMHMKGTPETMQIKPHYDDLFGEIAGFFSTSIEIGENAGIEPGNIILDPGIGFGKTPQQNLDLIRHLNRFEGLKKPILLGPSRKSFIGHFLDGAPAEDRLEGSLVSALTGVNQGASYLRVHDVAATVRAIKMASALGRRK